MMDSPRGAIGQTWLNGYVTKKYQRRFEIETGMMNSGIHDGSGVLGRLFCRRRHGSPANRLKDLVFPAIVFGFDGSFARESSIVKIPIDGSFSIHAIS